MKSETANPEANGPPVQLIDSGLVRWGAGTAFGALFLAFVVYIAGDSILAAVAVGLRLYARDAVIFSVVAYQFLVLGVGLSVGWLIMRRAGSGLDALGFRFPGVSTLVKALLALAPIFLGVELISAAFSTFLPGFHLQGNVKQELPVGTHVNVFRAVLILIWASIEAPFTEEVLFRGIMFQGIAKSARHGLGRGPAVFVGAVSSGTVFGLVHFEPHTLPILMFLGISLAYIFYYSRSIYASILVHGTVNAIAAISVFRGA